MICFCRLSNCAICWGVASSSSGVGSGSWWISFVNPFGNEPLGLEGGSGVGSGSWWISFLNPFGNEPLGLEGGSGVGSGWNYNTLTDSDSTIGPSGKSPRWSNVTLFSSIRMYGLPSIEKVCILCPFFQDSFPL